MKIFGRRQAGGWAVAFLALSTLSAVADIMQLEAGSSRVSQYHLEVMDDKAIHLSREKASPGDVIEAFPERILYEPFSHVDFRILPGFSATNATNFGEDVQPYVVRTGFQVEDCCSGIPTYFEVPPTETSGWVDLVWTFHYDDVTRPPGESGEYFDNWVKASIAGAGESPGGRSTVTISGGSVQAHDWLVPLAFASLIAGIALLIIWLRPDERHDEQTSLASAAEIGYHYLRRLRSMLLILAGPVMAVALLASGLLTNAAAEITGPRQGWQTPLLIIIQSAGAAATIAWAIVIVKVHRRMSAWKQEPEIVNL